MVMHWSTIYCTMEKLASLCSYLKIIMCPKTRELSIYLRDVLLNKQVKNYHKIHKTFNLNFSTVRSVIKRHKGTGSTMSNLWSGQPMHFLLWSDENL